MNKKEITFRSDCPISPALDIFGDKWTLLILRDLIFKGKNTYSDFLGSEEKIATNILADRLAMLECAGIITKHKHPDSKAKILYKLTSKGIDLIPALVEIIEWSEKYYLVHPDARAVVKELYQDKQGVIKSLFESAKGDSA